MVDIVPEQPDARPGEEECVEPVSTNDLSETVPGNKWKSGGGEDGLRAYGHLM